MAWLYCVVLASVVLASVVLASVVSASVVLASVVLASVELASVILECADAINAVIRQSTNIYDDWDLALLTF